MDDYTQIESADFNTISPGSGPGLEVPTAWALQNRTGFQSDASVVNFARTTNLMNKNASSSPKSYATLTGGVLLPARAYGSMNSQAKISYETTASPDYMSYANAYVPATTSVAAYYANSPSGNLARVGQTLSMMKR